MLISYVRLDHTLYSINYGILLESIEFYGGRVIPKPLPLDLSMHIDSLTT